MKKRWDEVEEETNTLKASNSKLESKMVDLESRSMRENLMFYGIAEGGEDENCEGLVKGVCRDVLKVTTADQMLFDRAHRVGRKYGTKVRPILVKFHYYNKRELVRKRSFDYADVLKQANMGVGAQLPKDICDARKALYPAMKKAKDEGKEVKFVRKKLFIGGVEHVEAGASAGPTPGPPPMDHYGCHGEPHLKILTWNVNGMKLKICEHDFLQYISQYDLVFLSETWVSKTEHINLDINGYICDFIPGNKTRRSRKGRFRGGISLYFKSYLKNYITVLEKHQSGIFWIKLSSELFSFDDDVYLCNLYNPPSSSNVLKSFDIDLYDLLETGIIKYNTLGKVFASGDVNACTSDSVDYITYDKYLDHDLQFFNPADIPLRKSQDQITD